MSGLILPFMILSAIGLLLSIATHIATLASIPLPGGKLVWALHIGIFVVWFPAVLVGKRMNKGQRQSDFWKNVLSGCPAWMRYTGIALFVYALGNFVWVMATGGFQKSQGDMPLSALRGFSGHWLVFYAAAFGIFFAAHRRRRLR